MPKRLKVLVGVLALALATAVPAFGQETAPQYQYGGDEETASGNATFVFELTVECKPPAGTEFLGFTATAGVVTTPLTDPDGDGVYTGSQTVPGFALGSPEESITIRPVRIVRGPPTGAGPFGPEYRILKDFGSVTSGDRTLSAGVSFCDDANGAPAPPRRPGLPATGGISSAAKALPPTGGLALPVAGAAGALLIAGGLLFRRISR